jgi:hypothetical protein
LLAASPLAGCIPSNVLASEDRRVEAAEVALAWRPAAAADLPGLWRARSIEGQAAAVLLDLCYWIAADGSFSGAALFAGPPPAYQVLSGTWSLAADGTLSFGADAAPARAEVGDELLRLSGAEGSLILERAQIR